jgi:hypothetical protein
LGRKAEVDSGGVSSPGMWSVLWYRGREPEYHINYEIGNCSEDLDKRLRFFSRKALMRESKVTLC